MKKSLMGWVSAVVLAVVGCNSAPPPSSANGYVLDVVAGNTNLDESLFGTNSDNAQSIRAQRLHLFQRDLNSRLGVSLIDSQTTAGVGRNFYISISKDGLPPSKPIGLKLSGPNGAYSSPSTYSAQTAWSVYFPLAQKGNGTYTVEAMVDDTRLSKQVQSVQGNGLEIPQVLGRGITTTDMAAKWSVVVGAQSYLILLYDTSTDQLVEGSVIKGTKVWLTGLKLDATKSYNIIIFALSWDATQSTQKVYPAPKPARFDASAVNLGTMVDGVKLEAIPSEIILSGKPGETLTGSIKIKNGLTGLLTYQSSIEGSTQIKLTNEKGAVLYQDEEVVEIEGTCHAGEVQELSHLRLTTNDPQQPSKVIPVKFECLAPLQAQLALKKTSPTGELLFADWSPDGSKIALAGTGGITVWNANTAELLGKYAGNTHAVWSPDGSELAGLVAQGVKIWSAQTGAEVRTISVANPKRVAWSLHGNKIAVVTQNNQVSVFSSTTSALLFQISTTYSDSITDLKWSPDGSKIATSSSDAIIWSGADGSEVRRLAGQYARLAWSPDSTRIVTGAYLNNATQHGVMNIWNAADGNLLDTISSFKFDVANIAWSPDGSQIAATGNDGDDGFKLKVWKTDKTPVSNLSAGSIVAWSPDGKNIISTTYSGLGRIWEIFANTSKAILGYHGGTVSTLEFAQGKLLSGDDSANGSVLNLLDLGSLNLLKSIEVGPPIFSAKLVGNTSIHTLLKIFSNWEIRSWDIASGKQLGAYIPPQTPSVAWSPSGQQVAVAVPNNPIRILDANSGTEALLLEDSTYDFDSYLAWSPDGNTLAAGQINRGILLWNATTGKKLIQYPSGIAGSFVWSLDGKKLAGGGKVFDVATGQTLLSLDKLAYPLAWNPEGRMIVSMQGNEITIYSALTGKKLLNLIDVNPSGYNAIAWSADGNHIAVGKTGELLLYKITLAP